MALVVTLCNQDSARRNEALCEFQNPGDMEKQAQNQIETIFAIEPQLVKVAHEKLHQRGASVAVSHLPRSGYRLRMAVYGGDPPTHG